MRNPKHFVRPSDTSPIQRAHIQTVFSRLKEFEEKESELNAAVDGERRMEILRNRVPWNRLCPATYGAYRELGLSKGNVDFSVNFLAYNGFLRIGEGQTLQLLNSRLETPNKLWEPPTKEELVATGWKQLQD